VPVGAGAGVLAGAQAASHKPSSAAHKTIERLMLLLCPGYWHDILPRMPS
jgi:hypothetical protein